jgi:hypothetical protein
LCRFEEFHGREPLHDAIKDYEKRAGMVLDLDEKVAGRRAYAVLSVPVVLHRCPYSISQSSKLTIVEASRHCGPDAAYRFDGERPRITFSSRQANST